MQIMPTSYNINQTSYALAGSDYTPSYDASGSNFSDSLNNAMNTYDQSYYNDKYNENVSSREDAEERAEERKNNMRKESDSFDINDHLQGPYTTSDRAHSDFVVEPARLIPTELNALAESLMQDGASIDAINAVKGMANKVGGVTGEQVALAVEDAMRGTRNNMSAEETSTLQNFCNRLNPSDPDKLYNSIRYGSGKEGIEAIEKAFGEMQGSRMASMSQDEITAIGRALNLSQGTISGLEEKLKEFNTSGASQTTLSQKDVESLLGNAEAEIQTQATSYDKTIASLEAHLSDAVKSAETREAAALEAQSREAKEVTQQRMLMEDTATTRALGDTMNNQDRANKASDESSIEKLQAQKAEVAQNEKAIQENQSNTKQEEVRFVQTERDRLASTLENATTVKKTLEANDALFEKSEQDFEWNNKEFSEAQNEKFNSLLGNGRDADLTNGFGTGNGNGENGAGSGTNSRTGREGQSSSSASLSFGDSAKFEYAFASASQSHYVMGSSSFSSASSNNSISGVSSINGIDNSLSRHATDMRTQVQNSITNSMMSMSGDGSKTIEVSLNPVELGQLNIALSIKNGEVNATIQAEKAESASMINAQMDAIRQELENQGFKIENIEVEVGVSQDNFADSRQDWQGAEYHNSNQQQFEQMQFVEQLQVLNKLSAIDRGERIPLARNMQDRGSVDSQTANSAVTGMHITV